MGARGADGLPTRRHSGPRAARAGGRRRPVEIMTDAPKPLTADDLLFTLRRMGAPKSTLFGKSVTDYVDLPAMRKLDSRTARLPSPRCR